MNKPLEVFFGAFSNGHEHLNFRFVDCDIRARLGSLVEGDRFVSQETLNRLCCALRNQWADIKSPRRKMKHKIGFETASGLEIRELDPQSAIPEDCVLLFDTGMDGRVCKKQKHLYLRMKLHRESFRRQGCVDMRKKVVQLAFSDEAGEPLSGFLDLPFRIDNLQEFPIALGQCLGKWYDPFRMNADIVKAWWRMGSPRELPLDLDIGIGDKKGEKVVLRLEALPSDRFDEDKRPVKTPCVLKLLKGGEEFNTVDFMPSFYRTVSIKAFKEKWRDLVEMAESGEPWDIVQGGDEERSRKSLESYMKITFDKLWLQNDEGVYRSLLPRNKEKDLIFCTGLVTKEKSNGYGGFIYGYCSDKKDGRYTKIEWITRKDPRAEAQSDERCYENHNLPWPALWTANPEELVYQYNLGSPRNAQGKKGLSGFAISHMIDRHSSRFPVRYLTSRVNEYGEPEVLDRNALAKDIYSAWKAAKKKLCANYKWAVPTFYSGVLDKDDGDECSLVCLLVPLYLDGDETHKPDVALVLRRQLMDGDPNKPYYFAPTCLTMEMARNNARVITRLDNTWLS